jgi:hypothetical protein
MANKTIIVKGNEIVLFSQNEEDYISLTDIARYKNPDEPKDAIKNWMRSRNIIEFMGLWEILNNPDFKGVEFDSFKQQAGSNHFTLSPQKWINATNAIGLISKSGKLGGTYAHKDIAFEFASWISSEFKLYLIKEFQRLKIEENERKQLGWSLKRDLAKINYKIHTDAVKENLIPPEITKQEEKMIYASEADVLNKALFGKTAKEWRDQNHGKEGNFRDYANVTQLVVLSNLENFNSEFIKDNIGQGERLVKLNRIAISQMKSLVDNKKVRQLEDKSK